jgi:hypothetical protein
MKLAEILHLCLLAQKTGCILYRREGSDGKLWVQEGQLHHAEFGKLHGEEAVYKMLESELGDASFLDGAKSTEKTIKHNSEQLLMESARRADEKSKTRMIPLPAIHPIKSALAMSTPKLIQFNVSGESQVHHLKPSKTSVGRAPHNDLCLPVESVSSIHCSFDVRGQKVLVTDQHSLNGTFVNGMRVIDPVELHEGDTVHMGSVALRYYWTTNPDGTVN